MGVNPIVDYNFTQAQLVDRINALKPQGYRLLSLSAYGNDSDHPRFAAVWDKRIGPSWRSYINYRFGDFLEECSRGTADGYHPALITAVGGGANRTISGVLEQIGPFHTTEITVDQDLAQFSAEVIKRAKDGWVIQSATIYDDLFASSRVAAVWRMNTENVAWNVFAGLTSAEHQAHFNAQHAGWVRLAFVTGSTRGRLLAVYRDDQIGPIGKGFVARHDLTLAAFLDEKNIWQDKGLYPVCVQGYESDADRRYAAIFVANEAPVQRVVRITGTPAVKDIDQAMIEEMKESNIRGAALAIVKGTKLVLARGYTWAEPDYPTVQPTTLFRIASNSKLIAAIGIHQLVAEGKIQLDSKLPDVLPLKTPDGKTPTNTAYLNGTVGQLLQYGGRFDRYEGDSPAVAAAFGTQLPVTHAQIASYMMTKPLLSSPNNEKLDDFGYFLAGEIIKRARGKSSLMQAIAPSITGPLQITRLRTARSLVTAQASDEARYHPRELTMEQSVMTPERPLVLPEYGNHSLETMETSGGLSAAAPDLARVLAAMNAKPYSPLGRPAIDSMLRAAAVNGKNGHGFDWLTTINASKGWYQGPKGGQLDTSQNALWYSVNGFSYVLLWNGKHTKGDLTIDDDEYPNGDSWYPQFMKVLDAAAKHAWPSTDLFPSYGWPSLPETQSQWRWCNKCQGMFYGGFGSGVCPAGGTHNATGSGSYHVMYNSQFDYGQDNWRQCKKCQSLFFAGNSLGVCSTGGAHEIAGGSTNYTLVHNSPYREPQQNWRWCNKCQSLFYAEVSMGVCPAGGTHVKTGSGNYSMAGL